MTVEFCSNDCLLCVLILVEQSHVKQNHIEQNHVEQNHVDLPLAYSIGVVAVTVFRQPT